MSPDLDPVAVTKPGADLPEERARLYEQAVRDGWVDLEWSPESHPGRLYGRRVARSASSCAVTPSPLPVARCLPNRADFRDRAVYAGADHRGIVVLPIGDCG